MSADLYHIGVTGSRYGASEEQVNEVFAYLKSVVLFRRLHDEQCALHHGDCKGFDIEAAEIGRYLGMWIVGHPPLNDRFRAHFASDEEREPKGYHERDRDLVDESAELVAAPRDDSGRGGTWYTVGYADRRGVPVLVTPSRFYIGRVS